MARIRGAPDSLLDTYEAERRPVAQAMLGLATGLLDAMKRGEIRRGRDVHQLDIGYPESSRAVEAPERHGGLLAGDRPPDARLRGAAGQPHHLFDLFKGRNWTLLACGPASVAARPDLHVHVIGAHGGLSDDAGQVRAAYRVAAGDRVLVRPDGYVRAIVAVGEDALLNAYLLPVGMAGRVDS